MVGSCASCVGLLVLAVLGRGSSAPGRSSTGSGRPSPGRCWSRWWSPPGRRGAARRGGRWSRPASGERVPVRTAYVAYYRSQLLNATLPGGVVGDVHRGVRHGWRGVVWERGIGQVVQVALVGALLLPGAWRWVGLAAVVLGAAAGGAVAAALRGRGGGPPASCSWSPRSRSAWRSAPSSCVPVGALVLLGAAIPLNVAGWGPREGVAAWAFAAFGSTAAVGLTVAVTFGVLAMVATLPGAPRPGEPPWLSVPTPCCRAACRSTASSTTPATSGCCCPTTPTSTGSTRCAPAPTRSWSGPPRSATTTRGCRSAPPTGSRAGVRRAGRPSRSR